MEGSYLVQRVATRPSLPFPDSTGWFIY